MKYRKTEIIRSKKPNRFGRKTATSNPYERERGETLQLGEDGVTERNRLRWHGLQQM
jgi:hypothetical protein